MEKDLDSTHDTQPATHPTHPNEGPTSRNHELREFSVASVLAVVAAVAATTLAAALARAAGVDFEIHDGGETIPVSGVAVVTAFFCCVGVVIAAVFLRWSTRPAVAFVRTALALTAASLVPPFLVGANAATVSALIGLHLVAATVMIPTVARGLLTRTDR
jgi:uncharacterized membrane protein YidH (DUF202 family)